MRQCGAERAEAGAGAILNPGADAREEAMVDAKIVPALLQEVRAVAEAKRVGSRPIRRTSVYHPMVIASPPALSLMVAVEVMIVMVIAIMVMVETVALRVATMRLSLHRSTEGIIRVWLMPWISSYVFPRTSVQMWRIVQFPLWCECRRMLYTRWRRF